MAVRLMTKSEYARHRGCDEKAVRKAIQERRITAIPQPNGREMIDPEVADIQWAKNTRARGDSGRSAAQMSSAGGEQGLGQESDPGVADVAGTVVSAPADDYQALRARRERAAVEAAERDNAREAGRLVDRDAISRGVFDSFRALRDAVMASPQRAAARVVGMGDVRDIERIITEELRRGFDNAEQTLQTLVQPKTEGVI